MLNVFPADANGKFDRTLLRQRGPLIQVQIGVPNALATQLSGTGKNIPPPIVAWGLIDSGASATAVDVDLLATLGIQPTGQVSLATPSHAQSTAGIYAVSLTFPQAPAKTSTVEPLAVMGCTLQAQGIGALLGRDFLEIAVLVYNGPGGFFSVSF